MNASRLAAALAHPRATAYLVRGRVRPAGLFDRYARLARRAGLDRVWFVLSFDCDTPEDAGVAWEVHERLRAMGVSAVWAVPGQLLREAAGVYGRIAETGAEFVNHGERIHTRLDEASGRWESTFFYDQQPREVLREDIVAADRSIREVTGRAPRGFRTPHFGTFQSPSQLAWLHGVLAELGYDYSTSTVPLWGFRHGPVFERFGRHELPVTGGAGSPLSVLDTWTYFDAPDRVRTAADFEADADRAAREHARIGAGILNVYGDPSHIHGREEFFRAVERWRAVAEPVGYGELLDRLAS